MVAGTVPVGAAELLSALSGVAEGVATTGVIDVSLDVAGREVEEAVGGF